jgi:spore germination protein YaaH
MPQVGSRRSRCRGRCGRRIIGPAGLAAALLLGFAANANASCTTHVVRDLHWHRVVGAGAGTLSWRPPLLAPAEVGYRVWRGSALVGVARARSQLIRVTPRHTYTFTVRVEDLVTGRVSACGAVMRQTILYHPPGMPTGLAVSAVTWGSVHLAWAAAPRGDGRLVGYRVYRNGVVVRQTTHRQVTLGNLYSAKAYNFYVRAVDSNGVQGARSRYVFATTSLPPPTHGHAAAFVLASDGESFADLRRHYMQIGSIYPTYYNCTPTAGIMGADDQLVTSWASARRIAVEPRFNCQNVAAIQTILTNPAVQSHVIGQLVALTQTYGYTGINVDFESAPASERDAFSAFVGNLAGALHAQGKRLIVEVSAAYYNQLTGRAGFYDYRALSAVSDRVVVMAWGKAWATSAPGGLDAQPWFGNVLGYVHTMPDPSKFRIGLTFYGIDWPAGGGAVNPGTPLEWQAVQQLIAAHGATPALDPTADDPHFSYTAAGIVHDVWYSNAHTVGDRVALAKADGLGVAFWRLGREDPTIWRNTQIN